MAARPVIAVSTVARTATMDVATAATGAHPAQVATLLIRTSHEESTAWQVDLNHRQTTERTVASAISMAERTAVAVSVEPPTVE